MTADVLRQVRTNQQFTGIQLLRFLAAMLVVVMHITQAISIHITGTGPGQYWGNGSAGVDIFFVISGFVMAITTADAQRAPAARAGAAWTFMKRRLLRIAPLYWFYTLLKVALLLAVPALAVTSSIDAGHLAASLFFIPAMSPWNFVEPVLPVGWTLNFEMLFYVVFALAIALGAPRIRLCLVVFVAILLAGRYWPGTAPAPLQFYANTIVFEFILGVCIATAYVRFKAGPVALGAAALLAGLLCIFGVDWGVSVDRLVTWGLGAALAVTGAVWLEPWTGRQAAAARLAFLGDASYSIYLSHTFVVPASVMVLKKLGVVSTLAIVPAVALVVVLAGCASYVWLERPMTQFLKRALFKPVRFSYPHPEETPAK